MGLFSKKKTEDKVEEKAQKKVEEKGDVNNAETPFSGNAYGVVISPIVTEKSHKMSQSQSRKYAFKVSSKAGKSDIKKAVEGMYSVNVSKVNILTVSGKKRTIKYDRGYQKSYKKAIVTLKKGQSVPVFEGV